MPSYSATALEQAQQVEEGQVEEEHCLERTEAQQD
jgi:hypothetical protein